MPGAPPYAYWELEGISKYISLSTKSSRVRRLRVPDNVLTSKNPCHINPKPRPGRKHFLRREARGRGEGGGGGEGEGLEGGGGLKVGGGGREGGRGGRGRGVHPTAKTPQVQVI